MSDDPTSPQSEPTDPDRHADTEKDHGASRDVKTPFSAHEDDDSALGDTDQHSTA